MDSPDGSRDALFMWNYATINLVNELARLPGVGNVTVMGAGQYSMRIWMDPQKLYSYNLVPEDVIRAVKEQSQEVAAGQVGMPPAPKDQQFQYTIDILSRFNDPGQFAEIVVKDQTAQGGRLIKVKDVARIDLGAQTYSQDFKLDGKPAAGIAIYQTPDANSLKVAAEVAAKMEELSHRFPPGLRYGIPYGPRMREELVIPVFIRKALTGEPIRIEGDGSQYRNYVYIDDLARAHLLALSPRAASSRFRSRPGCEMGMPDPLRYRAAWQTAQM